MKAPEWFLKELGAFDPDLRVRWSPQRQLWQLERRVRRALFPGTIKDDGEDDDVIRAREGYLLVASIPPRGFGRHIFQKLRESDLWVDGWQKIDRELCEAEAALEAKQWKDFDEDLHHMHREVFRFIAAREGRLIFSGGFPGIKE